MTLAVTGGRVLRPDGSTERADVLVDDGEIVAVGPDVGTDQHPQTLDATDALVVPGLVNAHCHAPMTLLRGNADDKPLGPWLREDIWPVEAELTPADVEAGAALGVLEQIRSGVTAFVDMYFEMDRVASVVEDAGLRALLGHGIISEGKDEAGAREELATAREFAEEYDGAADGRVQTALTPHSLTTVDPELLATCAETAADLDVPLHVHVNETEDEVDPIVEERGVRPLEFAADLGLLGPDTFVAHAVHTDEREIELLAETGTGVAHCPASNMKIASGAAPVTEMLATGVDVGVGTDGPATNNDLDVFDELRDAATLAKLRERDASAVPADEAFGLATEGAAAATGLPGGRVEPGAPADLAVVDLTAPHLTPVHDPVSHLAYAVRASDVRHTVCDGRVLMRDREVLTMDERRVIDRASEHAHDLLARAGRA
jgi:5-methylthioadenosine/S-adenosylhomocysteine deaminase